MEPRNDIAALTQANIPVQLAEFSCSYWGKHHPPTIDDETDHIVIETGLGYRSSRHTHGQNLYILETDPDQRIALIEMRKYGDLYGSGLWHYIIGIDDVPFVAQVSSTIDTLADALESLKPAEVRRAELSGLQVQRQGDWYFIPCRREPKGEIEIELALDGDHVVDNAIRRKTVVYVNGDVRHSQHATLYLDDWHKAVRNNAIRTGRLHRTGSRD